MTRRRAGLIALVSVACAGRTTQGSAVRLSVDAAAFAPTDTIRLTLANGSAADIGYNLCTARLERRAGDQWVPVPDDRMCTMELRLLSPRDSARDARVLDPSIEPGTYRLVLRVEGAGDVATNPFEIRSH